MRFPVIFHFGSFALSAHFFFEILAYITAYYCYKRMRERYGDPIPLDHRWTVIAAAAIGALAGSRLLYALNQAHSFPTFWQSITSASSGKTVVGGLLGAWLAVELIKKIKNISARTGDLFAVPLCVGIAIGRIGCFLAGLDDNTYGIATCLPWGVNFGDGIHRHPTQLYEVVFVCVLGIYLWLETKWPHINGSIFQHFLGAYLLFRLLVDFSKPGRFLYGLTMIQWACCCGLLILLVDEFINRRSGENSRFSDSQYD